MAANNANTTQNVKNLSLRSVLMKNKLNHHNYSSWCLDLFKVLEAEGTLYVIEKPIPEEPPESAKHLRNQWIKHVEDSDMVYLLMMDSMIPDLHDTLEYDSAYDLFQRLRLQFRECTRNERFETVRALQNCKMMVGDSVKKHMSTMIGHFDKLATLGFPIPDEIENDMILNSLSKSFETFVVNYNKRGWEKPIEELRDMLVAVEMSFPRQQEVISVNQQQTQSNFDSYKSRLVSTTGKGKVVVNSNMQHAITRDSIGKGKLVVQTKKEPVAASDPCFECGIIGHWKRNCPVYLKEIRRRRDAEEGSQGSTQGNGKEGK